MNKPDIDLDGLQEIVDKGSSILREEDAHKAHSEYIRWERNVSVWLRNKAPNSHLGPEWASLGISEIIVNGMYYSHPNIMTDFKVMLMKRMRWLASLAGEAKDIPKRIFISHGTPSNALNSLENFIRALGFDPVIAKDQPSRGKAVDDKVDSLINTCAAVIILATGDDKVEGENHKQPRQNVIHEIGLAQDTHSDRIIYLLEEGCEFPSNISPKVYERFTNDNVTEALIQIVREFKSFGIL